MPQTRPFSNTKRAVFPPGAAGEVHHRDRGPVFVVGHARSGTTILTKAIRQHLQIGFGTESQFIVRLHKHAESLGDLRDDRIRCRLIDTLARERFFFRTRAK